MPSPWNVLRRRDASGARATVPSWFRSALGAAIAVLVVTLIALAPGTAVHAHDDLAAASPAPGERVDDVVDQVAVDFGPPVTNPNLALIGPDGRRIDAELELIEDFGARLRFAPLTDAGVYEVRFLATVATDGHLLTGSYTFGYRANPPGVSSQSSLMPWIVTSWVALAIVAVGVFVWTRRAAARLGTDSDTTATV